MSNRCLRGPSHSAFIVPVICAALNIQHRGIDRVAARFGDDVFGAAVNEVRHILHATSLDVPLSYYDGEAYVMDYVQENILDAVEEHYPSGAFARLQTMVRDVERNMHATQGLSVLLSRGRDEVYGEPPMLST